MTTTDKLKLTVAFLFLAAGIAGFYYFGDRPTIIRLGVVLGAVALAAITAYLTESGKHAVVFIKEAYAETRKVVWPSRKETMQTTLVVFALVVVVAIFLWVVDYSLQWAIKLLMGRTD